MTPRELLNMVPVETSNSIYEVTQLFPELSCVTTEAEEDPKLLTHYYANVDFDGTRTFEVGAVFFDEHPVLIFRNAGRWKDHEYEGQWILDDDAYFDLVKYVLSLQPHRNDGPRAPRVGMDQDLGQEFTHFYGTDLQTMREYKR